MQRLASYLTLSSLVLVATASAQGQPHRVGLIPQLEKIDRQLAAYGMDLELRERNGGLVDASDFMNLDKWAFLPGGDMTDNGVGVESTAGESGGLQERGHCGGGIDPDGTTELRRRLIREAQSISQQSVPVRAKDVDRLRIVVLDGIVNEAMRSLGTGPEGADAQTASSAFATRVRLEVDPADRRQAADAEALIQEFAATVQRAERRSGTSAEDIDDAHAMLHKFRGDAQLARLRRAIQAGVDPGVLPIESWSMERTRKRRSRTQGLALSR